jgi:hypothetical protein
VGTTSFYLSPKDVPRDVIMAGLAAARPAPGAALRGALWFSTDSSILYRNSGSAWVTLASPGGAATIAIEEGDVGLGTAATIDFDAADFAISVAASEAEVAIATNAITNAKLRQSAGLSVIGRSASTTGDVADITAGTDAHVLRRSGTAIGFGQVDTGGIADAAVSYAKMQDVSAISRLLGRGSAAGVGPPVEITLGANLAMTGTTLSATGGGGGGISIVDLASAYGVTGDNTGNQATAINQAILDASGSTAAEGLGSLLLLPPGQVRITSSIEMRSQVWLMGHGMGATQIEVVGAFHAIVLQGAPTTNEHILTQVTDLHIDCNGQTGTNDGIHYDQTAGDNNWPITGSDPIHTIERVRVTGANGYGIRLMGEASQEGRVLWCYARDCDIAGFFADSGADCWFINCTASSGAGVGFQISGGNNRVVGCKAFFCDTDGFALSSSRGEITGCESQDNGRHGFNITGSDWAVSACAADSNNRLNTSGDGFVIAGARTVLSGIQVYGRNGGDGAIAHGGSGSGDGVHRYGLNITAQNISVQGHIKNWMTTGAAINNTQSAQSMSFDGLTYSGIANRFAITSNASANGGTGGVQVLSSFTIPDNALFLGTTYRWWASGTQTHGNVDVVQTFRLRMHNAFANIVTLYSTAHSRSGLNQGALHGSNTTRVVSGAGASTNITVTGIETADVLVKVLRFTTAASIATMTDITSTCTITAQNTIQSSLNTTGDQLLVEWGRQFAPNGTIATARDWFGMGVVTARTAPSASQTLIGGGHVHFTGTDQGGVPNASGGFDTDAQNTGTLDGTAVVTLDASIEFGAGRTSADIFTLEQFVVERVA